MKVALISPEVVPFAKTGGLADVSGALPKALARIGVEVAVVMPRYRAVDEKKFGLVRHARKVTAKVDGREVESGIFEGSLPGGVKVYFLDNPAYYGRDQLYGTPQGDYPDNAERFTYFCKAVPEVLKAVGFKPDVMHVNDWQSGLVPLYLKEFYGADPDFTGTGTVITVHNLGYQGVFWAEDMHLTGLGWEHFTPDGIEFYGKINCLKAGLVHSDIINTVSKTYGKEIQTPEYGCGLEGVLTARDADLYGIVNGIDYDEWDPEKDKNLAQNFGAGDVKGKLANKKALLKELGLPATGNRPLFGIISRLADQKGLDILSESMDEMLGLGVQFVMLGTGEEKYHKLFTELAKTNPRQVSVNIGFDAKLATRIYAGTDVFLMPSRYEPCGLGQLISLRYGTVPLVRKTGGLADTVKNYSVRTGKGNGFVFTDYSSRALMKAVKAAVAAYEDKAAWKGLVERGMNEDNSWERSAREYVKLYRKAMDKAAAKEEDAAA
ncbi:MAG: glycogen synthase GlgA [Nitrospirae bacterium]|nr:glycogen synthase GlgA [Nitrospirota bacterium]